MQSVLYSLYTEERWVILVTLLVHTYNQLLTHLATAPINTRLEKITISNSQEFSSTDATNHARSILLWTDLKRPSYRTSDYNCQH